MKLIPTVALSTLFMVASTGIIAEEGLIKSIGQSSYVPKSLIKIKASHRAIDFNHIRELHGDINQPRPLHSKTLKRALRLAKYKAKLKQQKQNRRLGISGLRVTSAL